MHRKSLKAISAAFALGMALTLLTGTAATAHPDAMQHDETNDNHLPPVQRGVDLIGTLDLFSENDQDGRISDVGAFGNYAYLGVFASPNCEDTGIYVVDITNPAEPKPAVDPATEDPVFIPADPGSFAGEGVQVLDMDIPGGFKGQVLIHSNETCLPQGGAALGPDPRLGLAGPGGASLWDVTEPLDPQPLASHVGDIDPNPSGVPHNTHSSFGWQQGNKAYMVLVDNGEFGATDIDIFDITNPRSPKLVVETGMDDFPQVREDPMPHGNSPFIHDFMVNRFGDKYIFLGSYWDGGYITLDFTNLPQKPTFIGHTDFGAVEPLAAEMNPPIPVATTPEGNAHQAEFNRDGTLFLGADEDFGPRRIEISIDSGEFQGERFDATSGADTPAPLTPISGGTDFVGFGCEPQPPALNPIALVERGGGCTFGIKWDNIRNAGYKAGIVFNERRPKELATAGEDCDSQVTMAVGQPGENPGEIPFVFVNRSTGLKILSVTEYTLDDPCITPTPPPRSPAADTTMSSFFDGWGYLHLYDANSMEAIDHWALPEALDSSKQTGSGDLSIHEVATDPDEDVAYISHYAGGFRVVEFDRAGIREVGAYIDEGGNNFWGVEVHQHPTAGKIVLASDRDAGLYIFGPAAPDLTVANVTAANAPRQGQRVTLTATVPNIGSLPASNVTVRFLENGTQIGAVQTISEIDTGDSGQASVIWKPKRKGSRTITVVVDPANAIKELNEDNNSATKVFTVR